MSMQCCIYVPFSLHPSLFPFLFSFPSFPPPPPPLTVFPPSSPSHYLLSPPSFHSSSPPPFLFPFLSFHYSLATLKGSSLLLYQCDDITNLSEDAHVDLRLGKQSTPLNSTIACCTKFNQSYKDILLLYTVQSGCVSLVSACLYVLKIEYILLSY